MGTMPIMLERRQGLHARLLDARARTDALFAIVRRDALYDRPIPERHRIVFYIGHLEAFDWNLIGRRAYGIDAFRADFDKLFAFGIDPTGGGLPNDQASEWPGLEEIRAYTDRLRRTVDQCLLDPARLTDQAPALEPSLAFEVAIEHRLMHAETLAYMLHRLPIDRKTPQSDPAPPPSRGTDSRMVAIPRGNATLGLRRGGDKFGWDNEFDLQIVEVPDFRIDANSVTHGQYLEFMRAGGYDARELWSDEAWEWRSRHDIRHPGFWQRRGGDEWVFRGMFGERPLPLDLPVYVSHAEASAYCRWRGRSLPTEAQFHRAAYGTPEGAERAYPWGDAPPDPERGNFDFQRWDPTPVHAYPRGDSAFGVSDLVGNGWEWTSTVFGPLPGFQPFSFYPGYSADFFDGKHYVMKGGSARTAAAMLRRSFRNWFQALYPYVYAKFRCVEP